MDNITVVIHLACVHCPDRRQSSAMVQGGAVILPLLFRGIADQSLCRRFQATILRRQAGGLKPQLPL
jgi:hypothetical protein